MGGVAPLARAGGDCLACHFGWRAVAAGVAPKLAGRASELRAVICRARCQPQPLHNPRTQVRALPLLSPVGSALRDDAESLRCSLSRVNSSCVSVRFTI